MLIPVYTVIIQGGQLTFKKKAEFYDYIRTLKDGEYLLSVKKQKKTRTDQQNRYLWGVVYEVISGETGMSQDEVHGFCKMSFLKKQVGRFLTLGSTATLSKFDFGEYVDKIRAWAGQELGIVIPDAGEVESAS